MRTNKIINGIKRQVNNLMLGLCVVLFAICFYTTNEVSSDTETIKIEPYTVAILEDGSKQYYFDLSDFDYHYTSIMFFTSHQQVKGYNSGRLIYEYTTDGGFWTSTGGSLYNFIEVNEKMLQVAITVTPVYDIVKDQHIDFYIGTSYQIYNDMVSKSMPRFVSSILIIIFSGLIFIYYLFMHKKQQLDKALIYLGYFSLFIGVWTASETAVCTLIFDNKVLNSLIQYYCLMMAVPPFVLFFDMYLEVNSKILKNIIVFASMIQFVVLNILHYTKIAEFRETLVYVQAMLVVALTYVIGCVIKQMFSGNITRNAKVCAVGLSVFLVTLVVDIVNFYFNWGDADYIGRYMFLVFIIALATDLIKGTYEIIEKGRSAKRLEEFALTDSMTGLFNRNAFEKRTKRTEQKLDGVTVVVADANGLKHCNDTYGHEAGDEYISVVAEIFNKVYGKYGNCYRIGGDEFCCIIPSNKHTDMERLKNLFSAKVYTANLEGDHIFTIGVAVGSAEYDSSKDEDIKALIKRADASMYENKKQSKAI
ncbi:GGDEF domain-containing protein [Pseudobutyrivibrio xylanivorans]|uniref:GGDEF domain-containing protein n=1 Tax=Pseudobutyrivibrio xylanivorans TaxID=185007 RepID=A0A5P6VQI6_PSEXY|nr:GGDEF domain-containing protein [Pseudobutyrivibrio xylanivorans]QFJ54642.1 GGDEF domain-containing protein [Pseudobutyrivibrio xylanivorans]